MNEISFFKAQHYISPLEVRNIGIVYCTSNQYPPGREHEQVADCEVVDVAHAVQSVLNKKGYQAELVDLDPKRIEELRRFDWVFNLTESVYGYPLADFEVAAEMEKYNIQFTGGGSKTLEACLDKAETKCELLMNGIGTPPYVVFQLGDPIWTVLKYPVIVKPIHEDGSIGITIDSVVRCGENLEMQVQRVHQMYHQAALAEEYIDGRDISASVLGNGEEAMVLPLSETVYSEQAEEKLLTFDAKWLTDTPDFQAAGSRCPCILSVKAEALIKRIALRAYRVIGCRDYARIDFRLRGKEAFMLEVNPNPCINPEDSGFVRASEAAGISYADMVTKILESSIRDRLQMPQSVLKDKLVLESGRLE
jgi:D-alanine-D-alanine ligase